MRQSSSLIALMAAVALVPCTAVSTRAQRDLNPAIFRLKAEECAAGGSPRLQTAFVARVQGEIGLVTALHGVVDCDLVSAENERYHKLERLNLALVDVRRDVAFFTTSELIGSPLQTVSSVTDSDTFVVIGYPRGVEVQLQHSLEAQELPIVKLAWLASGSDSKSFSGLAIRRSPDLEQQVLSLRGNLQSGHSGAPILDMRQLVVAVGSGGLAGGSADINWAIPYSSIRWSAPDAERDELRRIARLDPLLSFAMYDDAGYNLAYQRWFMLVGGMLYTSSDLQSDKGGLLSAIIYPAILDNRLGFGVEGGIQWREYSITYVTLPGIPMQTTPIEARTRFLSLLGRWHFKPRKSTPALDPYVNASLGLSSASAGEIDGDTAPHVSVGGGFQWVVSRKLRLALTCDVRWVSTRVAGEAVEFDWLGNAEVTSTGSQEQFCMFGVGLNYMLRLTRR